MRMAGELLNAFVQCVGKGDSARWAVAGDELENGQKFLLGDWEISQGQISEHGGAVAALPPFDGG